MNHNPDLLLVTLDNHLLILELYVAYATKKLDIVHDISMLVMKERILALICSQILTYHFIVVLEIYFDSLGIFGLSSVKIVSISCILNCQTNAFLACHLWLKIGLY